MESGFSTVGSATTDSSNTQYYPLANIPVNFATTYDKLLINNGWKASGSDTISGDLVYYYKKMTERYG
jgi:hypothetical protein